MGMFSWWKLWSVLWTITLCLILEAMCNRVGPSPPQHGLYLGSWESRSCMFSILSQSLSPVVHWATSISFYPEKSLILAKWQYFAAFMNSKCIDYYFVSFKSFIFLFTPDLLIIFPTVHISGILVSKNLKRK